MSILINDIPVIDKDDFKKLKKLKGQKLMNVKQDDEEYDLILEFEKMKVTLSMQDSDAYGTNVFFSFVEIA